MTHTTFKVLPNGRSDLNSFHVGHWVAPGGMCAPCSSGSYYREDEESCRLCPRGKFQPGEAQLSCFECPPTAPITTSIGSMSSSDCKVKCGPGHYLNMASNECESCGFGFYQPSSGAFECIPCGVGKTTLEMTSASEEECRDECPDGEQLTKAGSCQSCPMGTFRSRGEDKRCVECPDGTTTEGVGAVKSGDCNTPKRAEPICISKPKLSKDEYSQLTPEDVQNVAIVTMHAVRLELWSVEGSLTDEIIAFFNADTRRVDIRPANYEFWFMPLLPEGQRKWEKRTEVPIDEVVFETMAESPRVIDALGKLGYLRDYGGAPRHRNCSGYQSSLMRFLGQWKADPNKPRVV